MSALTADNWAEISKYCKVEILLELRRAHSICRDGVHAHVRGLQRHEIADINRWLIRMTVPTWQKRPDNLRDACGPWCIENSEKRIAYLCWARFGSIVGVFKAPESMPLFYALFNFGQKLSRGYFFTSFLKNSQPNRVSVDALLDIYRLLNEPSILKFLYHFTTESIDEENPWKIALEHELAAGTSNEPRILLVAISSHICSGVALCSLLDCLDELIGGANIRMVIKTNGHRDALSWFIRRDRKQVELRELSQEDWHLIDEVYILKCKHHWLQHIPEPEVDDVWRRAHEASKFHRMICLY